MAQGPKQSFKLDNYVEVSDRVRAWFETHPEGRIETEIVSITETLVVTKSRVYRTADPAERPAGEGHSMLAIPGSTPYTRGSELENCETSSVGRALVMAGVPAKRIASDHEIRVKENEFERPRPTANGNGHARNAVPPPKRPTPEADALGRYFRDTLKLTAPAMLTPLLEAGSGLEVSTMDELRAREDSDSCARVIRSTLEALVAAGKTPQQIREWAETTVREAREESQIPY